MLLVTPSSFIYGIAYKKTFGNIVFLLKLILPEISMASTKFQCIYFCYLNFTMFFLEIGDKKYYKLLGHFQVYMHDASKPFVLVTELLIN